MTFLRIAIAAVAMSIALIAAWPGGGATASAREAASPMPAADFTGANRWYNSPPLSLQALRGKVVLVEFWTYECINCVHVLPHTRELYDRYARDGLVVVGVHTPEYDEERDPAHVEAAIHALGVTWPVAMDNDYRIWNAYGNQYWPAIYLIDRDGRVVYRHFGEGNYDVTEQRIRQLLGKA
ncbi:redoxin family protein [Dyella soli]|uniref:Redoxin domain-containing protein n=1 Tax=Dyella soli TaxID=522319 RepID=A0A4R0YII9_9GAMM|nr:redoxin family protein [Dyella soli]TCI07002.1 redoxin domain-containing protein [Dyella soli]